MENTIDNQGNTYFSFNREQLSDEQQKHFIDEFTEIKPAENIVYFDESPFCSKGGLSLVSGIQKGGKTTVLGVMLEVFLLDGTLPLGYDNLAVTAERKSNEIAIYFSTELSDSEVMQLRDRIKKNSKMSEIKNLLFFNVLTLDYKKRLDFIVLLWHFGKSVNISFPLLVPHL